MRVRFWGTRGSLPVSLDADGVRAKVRAAVAAARDASLPDDLAARARYSFRRGFLGDGYARTNATIDRAVSVARDELGLELESTYTGKAFAALLHDLEQSHSAPRSVLFWNTYNSRPLPADGARPADTTGLPEEFLRYYDPA